VLADRGVQGNFVRRSVLLIPVAAVLVSVLASCSNKDPGQAVPAGTPSGPAGSGGPFPTGSGSTSASGSQPSAPAGPLKDTKPCSLLSASDIAELQAGQGTEETLNNVRTCRFVHAAGFAVSVGILDDLGLDDVTTYGSVKPVPTVGQHKAVQSMRGVDTCAISIEVTKTSRVDTQGTSDDGNVQKACDLALHVARLVEPKLPV
jgi:hypothetical protein